MVISMVNGSYCRCRMLLTIFEVNWMKFGVSPTPFVCKLDHHRRHGERFLLTLIFGTKYHKILTEVWRII